MQTNGDDILENWEEIDEAGLSNTLRKIQAERQTPQDFNSIGSSSSASSKAQTAHHLSATTTSEGGQKSQMKLLQRKTTENNSSSNTISAVTLKSPLDDMSATFEPVMMVLHKSEDEYQSVNYTQPINSQTVKILRRPTQSSEPRNNGLRPRQPIKTLQQREQEYAEARLRILGSAKNPEDDVGVTNSNGSVASSSSSPTTTAAIISAAPITKGNSNKAQGGQNVYNNHYYQQQQQSYYYQQPTSAYNNRTVLTLPPLQHQQQTWSPVVGGSVSSSALRLQQQQDSILRAPRGPDGSTGFQMRR